MPPALGIFFDNLPKTNTRGNDNNDMMIQTNSDAGPTF